MFKRILSLALTTCVLLSCIVAGDFTSLNAEAATDSVVSTSATNLNYGLVDNVQYGQILHCWNWSFDNIRKNMQLIASQGFTAIQTSPIQSSKESTRESWSSVQNSAWVYYQPISFNIEQNSWNALGTKSQFEAMCAEAHKYGVKVIVDTVFNHMANDSTENTINSQISSDLRDDSSCWYSITWNCSNWEDRYDVTHNCLSGFPDLNTSNSKVQSYAIGFLKECIDAGADGFRFDAAKHIETPSDAYGTSSDFWPNVLGTATYHAQQTRGITPYYYGELLGSPGGGLSVTAYTDYMSVTDNNTGNTIRDAIASGNASGACIAGISNGAAPDKAVQWNESHDTYYADNNSIWISNENMKKTWAIVGSRAQVCGLYLARPENNETTMLGDGDITAWADKEVKAINKFKNYFAGHSEYLASSGNIVYNERGNTGVVLVNATGGSTSVSVPAHQMWDGIYTDAITGNHFSVSNGTISGEIGSSGIAVVYSYPSTVDVDKSSQAFRGDTLDVTLKYNEATGGTYTIGDEYSQNYTYGDVVSVGCGVEYGESVDMVVTASGGTTTDSVVNTYKKLHPDTDLKMYFNNSSKNWSQVYAYIYNSDGDKVKSWPGTEMAYDSSLGLYYIDVPNGFETSKVVFNDGNGNQTPSSGGHSFNAYTSIYKDGYFYGYNTGVQGTLYFKPSDNWKSDNARFAVYVWNGSSNSWVSFSDSDGDGIYEAKLPNGIWTECIFARMNPSTSSNNWDNIWNQTGDMGISNNHNYFMIADGWDTSSGTWSIIDKSVIGSETDAQLVGTFNNWDTSANPFVYTDYNQAVTQVDLPAGTYTFKMLKNDDWFGNPGTIQDTTAGNGWRMCKNDSESCTLNASGGSYTFTLNTETLKISVDYEAKEVEPLPTEEATETPTQIETEAPTAVNTDAPTTSGLSSGYYLVGTLNGKDCWGVSSLSEDRKLSENPGNSGEYMLDYTFKNGDEIKVVKFDGTDYTRWYNSSGENYSIGSSKAGNCTLYFRPEGNSSWSYYYFTVIPKTVEETEAPTEEVTVAPTKVENIIATPAASNAVLTWDAVDGATKYWVYKYNESANSWGVYTSNTATKVTVGSLLGSTTYQVKVVATLSDGSTMSLSKADVVEFTTLEPVVVDTLKATPSTTSAELSWEAVEGAQKYWIYKVFEENGPFYVYDATTELSYTVKHLQAETTYYFKVVPAILSNGLLALGEKDACPDIAVTTTTGDVITTVVTGVTSTTATISWPAFENAVKYWVIYSTTTKSTSDLSKWTTWAETTDTTYTFKWREPSKYYFFSVVALYNDEETGSQGTVNYIGAGARMLYSDSNFITFTPVDEDTVTLSWPSDTGATKVWVSYFDENGKETVVTSTTANTVTLDLKNYQNYSFGLNALDSTGNVGYLTPKGGEKYHTD